MSENRIDKYLRGEDTLVARVVKRASMLTGPSYRVSRPKRAIELSVALPAAIITTPLISALVVVNRLLYAKDPFFVQERIGKRGESVPLVKIRCMKPDSEKNIQASLKNGAIYKAGEDPRNTPLGRVLRKYEIEETPQLWQVVMNQLSLIGIRSAPQYVFDHLEQTRPRSFSEWTSAYFSGKPGLISLNAVCNPERKNDDKRHHYDLLYSKKASLGLDCPSR